MNKFFSLLIVSILLSWTSCSTDFSLEGDWEDVPIVYGFISVQDTAHYIRVEKAFLEPGGDATQIAKIPDSLYYDNALVQIEKVLSGEVYTLERVDGNLEGYPREEGPFATSPNYLYKIKADEIDLTGGEEIRLLLTTGENTEPVTAQTNVLRKLTPRDNSPSSPAKLYPYDKDVNFSWFIGEFAKVFDFRIRINYKESVPGSTELVDKSLEWVIDKNLIKEGDPERISVGIRSERFYQFIGGALEPVSDRFRTLESMDLIIVGGGQEFVDYFEIADANLGITSSNTIPVYTNLSEGLGIFTSRYFLVREGIEFDAITMDSLRTGIYTRELSFQ
ncbi:MAG: hypothetical protein DHS20C18_50430 [Saprospiraceae bacterium]|nr:MAG: hypothetical protein DHS20C18_50430 [Saprospiraceae bacterium]